MGFGGQNNAELTGSDPETDLQVHYAAHVEEFHQEMLNGDVGNGPQSHLLFDVVELLNNASTYIGGSPYGGVIAFDPQEAIDEISNRYDQFNDIVNSLDPSVDLNTAILFAQTYYTPTSELAKIDDYIDSLENKQKAAFLKETARVASGLFDIRGVMSTQFGMTMATMEEGRRNSVDAAAAEMRLACYRLNQEQVLRMVDQFLKYAVIRIQSNQAATGMLADLNRQKIVAKQDQISFDLEMMVKDQLWDLELMQYGQNALASVGGGQLMPRAQTQRERMLGAITSSLSTGFQLGSSAGMFGPEAGIISGVVGALGTFAAQMWSMGG